MSNPLTTQLHDTILNVALPEEFDGFLVDKAREQLEDIALECSNDVILDFNNTQFIDSSGVGAIVFLFKRLRSQQRDLNLVNVYGQPKKLLEMLHVDRTIATNQQETVGIT